MVNTKEFCTLNGMKYIKDMSPSHECFCRCNIIKTDFTVCS